MQFHYSSPLFAQVLLHVPQKNCVITWDFDILKGDVVFTVFRLQKPYRGKPHTHHLHGGGTLARGSISLQFLQKNWKIGLEMHVIQSPVVCHNGDSIQVRYYNVFLSYFNVFYWILVFVLCHSLHPYFYNKYV